MMLLRLISWPYIRKHGVRSALTILGIVIGVAVFVAMHTANQAVFFAFQRTVDKIAGATQLQVSSGESGFPEDVLEQVQAAPGVRVAVPVIEAVAGTGLAGQGNVLILGVDMTGDRSLRDYDLESGDDAIIDDPLVFLAQPDSIMITREFAARNHLEINSKVTLLTAEGSKAFTVRGIMKSGGMTTAFGGNLAVMDIYAAQLVFGRGRRFDRVDLALQDNVSIDQGRQALTKLLGPGFNVDQPSAREEQFESTLHVYSVTMGLSSVFALFIGMFIIYNSFAIAVTQRRSEIGILRALGATRRQIRWLFLTESAISGLIGSALGVVLGVLLARSMTGYIGAMLEGIYGVAERAEEVSADPRLITLSVVIGIITSMIAAWIPSRNAARVDPVQALQKGKYQVLSAGENRIRWIVALCCAAASIWCMLFTRSGPLFYTGYLLTIVSALLLTPAAALRLAKILRPLLKWLRPVEGALAADSLIQAPRRTSGTVSALMLALAQVVGLGGVSQASRQSILDWLNAALNPDLFIAASQNLSDRTFRYPASLGNELEALPGIAEVQRVRSFRTLYNHTPVLMVAVELQNLSRRVHRETIQGDETTMYATASRGEGVIVSDNFSRLQHRNLGDMLEIPAPKGVMRLPVVGVVQDWSDQQGSIFMDRSVLRRYWDDDSVNIFRVYVKPGVPIPEAKARIVDAIGSTRRLFVMTNEDVRRYILQLTDQWIGLTYMQIVIAVLVAVLGIINSLTVSIIDRQREIGVLRAVGGLRNQIRRTVWMEAIGIGLIGTILGVGLGAVNLYYVLQLTQRDLTGMHLAYVFPLQIALITLPTILATAFLASIWPGESAVRGSLVEALEYE